MSNPGYSLTRTSPRYCSFRSCPCSGNPEVRILLVGGGVWEPAFTPIDEDHPKMPVNSYGETKLMLERALQWYASAYGWNVVAFRYFNACGATDIVGEDHRPETHIIPLLLQTATGERDRFQIYGGDYSTPDGTCVRPLRACRRYCSGPLAGFASAQ